MSAPLHAIALSVVVPTMDHRGHIVEAVSSWTRGQDLARDRYEVLLVTNGREPAVAAAAAPLLTGADRLLTLEGANEPALHDHGARQARGKWLLFTEAHCVAAPDCLSALLAYLEAHAANLHGACLRTLPDRNLHPVAQLEARAYQDGFATWSRPGDWRKISIRGVAVRRDAYHDAGGFDGALGCFAEMALAADLHASGYRLGYAEGAAIKHYNADNVDDLLSYVREYRAGEVAYRDRCPADRFEAYFDCPGSWTEATASERRMALRCAASCLLSAAAARFRAESTGPARAMLAVIAGRAGDSMTGGRMGLLKARVAYAWCRARFMRPGLDADERYRRYRALWDAVGDLGRERALSRRRSEVAPPTGAVSPSLEFRPGLMPATALVGFHARETWDGQPFRWSSPLALARLAVDQDDYEVRVDTCGLVASGRGAADLYVNGRRTRPMESPAAGSLAFRADRAMFRAAGAQVVVLAAPRLVADPAERRALGLPVFRIAFVPARGTVAVA